MSSANASPAANRPGTMRRRRALSLLTGVSGVALTMGSALSGAAAAERPVPVVVRGDDGQKADDFLIDVFGTLARNSTPGKDGGSLSLIDVDPRAAAKNPAVSIAVGSTGGTGGAGYERGWNWRPASAGGRGGSGRPLGGEAACAGVRLRECSGNAQSARGVVATATTPRSPGRSSLGMAGREDQFPGLSVLGEPGRDRRVIEGT